MKIICFIIPLICFQAVAQNKTVIDKVDGFSTYKFGMSKTSCGCNVTEENKDDWWCESIYPKNLSVGEFLVSHLDMAFGSNGLEKIIVNFKNPNKEKLLAKLTEKYGKPLIEYKNENNIKTIDGYRWEGSVVVIYFDITDKGCYINYYNKGKKVSTGL
jgi:hypothetical protein